ncbi:MAG: hypothetical protein DPW18_04970 [Chloroflexi bacterium]|nr:hypothetical protein [Chloroflexota bacterium]MDL1943198.1 hypothetical protein [Chloroflexi bacterium CFX2]
MNKKYSPFILAVIVLLTAQLACNVPSDAGTPDTFATLNGLYTASALTLEAAGTQSGLTATPGLPLPTVTIAGSPSATNPPALQSPAPQSRCDAAQFLADVTYPDGSVLQRSTTFVKIWRIKNIGTCTWTTSYALVFAGGDALGGPAAVGMPGTVSPGQYIEIPVTLNSPNKDGSYTGYWKLRNASGAMFGIGAQADTAFWVKIRVAGTVHAAYNFADNYCKADWSNGKSSLPCPGSDGDPSGYVIRLNAPKMENGVKEDEPGLLTVPQDKQNGSISGEFPAFTVQAGDRFRALINCQYEAVKCNVIFKLEYKNNGQIRTLASWAEVYEGKYYPVDLDLSSLAGETVKFILTVNANGGNKHDYAIWLNPHIARQGNAPTATATKPPTKTFTPTITFTPTLTFTPTITFTPTSTFTPTAPPTATSTETPISTATP